MLRVFEANWEDLTLNLAKAERLFHKPYKILKVIKESMERHASWKGLIGFRRESSEKPMNRIS
jgi:hypothetical protein